MDLFKAYIWIILLIAVPLIFSCRDKKYPDLETVKKVDLERYAGKWYEISRLPNFFEKGLMCVTATYGLGKNGKISVVNRGHNEKSISDISIARGRAWVPDKNEPGRLKVSFFWPFSGDYWIIDLDQEDYSYALVGSPSRKYLWVLARDKSIDDTKYASLVEKAKAAGFDTAGLIKTSQICE